MIKIKKKYSKILNIFFILKRCANLKSKRFSFIRFCIADRNSIRKFKGPTGVNQFTEIPVADLILFESKESIVIYMP